MPAGHPAASAQGTRHQGRRHRLPGYRGAVTAGWRPALCMAGPAPRPLLRREFRSQAGSGPALPSGMRPAPGLRHGRSHCMAAGPGVSKGPTGTRRHGAQGSEVGPSRPPPDTAVLHHDRCPPRAAPGGRAPCQPAPLPGKGVGGRGAACRGGSLGMNFEGSLRPRRLPPSFPPGSPATAAVYETGAWPGRVLLCFRNTCCQLPALTFGLASTVWGLGDNRGSPASLPNANAETLELENGRPSSVSKTTSPRAGTAREGKPTGSASQSLYEPRGEP